MSSSLPEGIHAIVTASRKIDSCCDVGSCRYLIGAVEIIPASGADGGLWATATDGKCLSVVKTAGETEERKPYYLPAKLLRPSKKPATAKLNGRWESADRMADQPEGRYPQVQDVLPDCADRQTITLNADLLAQLAAAISANGNVTLLLPPVETDKNGKKPDYRAAIGVVGDDGFGVLMPLTDCTGAIAAYQAGRSAFSADRIAATQSPVAPIV